MLLRFAVENFGAFRERAELSFIAGKDQKSGAVAIETPGGPLDVLTVVALWGPNAGGKTTILQAIQAMARAVRDSHRTWNPSGGIPSNVRRPFALTRNHPTTFEVDFLVKEVRYAFSFSADDQQILTESLASWDEGRRRLIYDRTGSSVRVGRSHPAAKKIALLKKFARKNSLILSVGAQNDLQQLMPVYELLKDLTIADDSNDVAREHYTTYRLAKDKLGQKKLLQLLREADFGIKNVHMDELEIPLSTRQVLKALTEAGVGVDTLPGPDEKLPSLRFVHCGRGKETFDLRRAEESDGTLAFLRLAFPVIDAIETNATLLVDELERSLHLSLAAALLSRFLKSDSRTQLLFTTHSPSILDMLRRDAVWFTEKDEAGESSLYPLTDFHPRHDAKLSKAYFGGRFGAVPHIPSVLYDQPD